MYNSTSSSRLNLLYLHDRSLRVIYINGIKTMISRVISLNFVPHYLEKLGYVLKLFSNVIGNINLYIFIVGSLILVSLALACMCALTHTYF